MRNMPDYEKLTVVKLRDELVLRGLPKTGLKAALIQRLHEADAQAEKTESAPVGSSKIDQEDQTVTKAAPLTPQALRRPNTSDHAADDALQSGEQNKIDFRISEMEDRVTSLHQSEKQVLTQYQTGEIREAEPVDQAPDSFTPNSMRGEKTSLKTNEKQEQPKLQVLASAQIRNGEAQAAEGTAEMSTHTSLTGDEILEDSRKRKRRSQSPPPPSAEKTQKRFKSDNGRPLVELPEDSVVECADQQEGPNGGQSQPDLFLAIDSFTHTNGQTYSKRENRPATVGQRDVERVSHSETNPSPLKDLSSPRKSSASPKSANNFQSPIKSSSSESQFGTLLTSHANLDPTPQQSHRQEADEKLVSAALHPATSALYIRELMRPLKTEDLRGHLIALATPPGTAMNSDIVTDFYLDAIRTHCFVGFENISAASRVRSGLHDRVWPNERDRRQLWVDFIPEEKLKSWINIERTAGDRRTHLSKRWEVVYEDEENGIKAYLQEIGPEGGGLRAAPPVQLDAGQSVHVTGVQNDGLELPSAQLKPDGGKGFQALDELFMSTASKPRLYYLPVAKIEVDRRLGKLAAGRGGGRGDEMRRFSFEEGSIIDNGPDFVRSYGRGGSYSGSYSGRGRGYRADPLRGDSWKERRKEY